MKAIAIKLSKEQQIKIKYIKICHRRREALGFEGEAQRANMDLGHLLDIIRQGAVE